MVLRREADVALQLAVQLARAAGQDAEEGHPAHERLEVPAHHQALLHGVWGVDDDQQPQRAPQLGEGQVPEGQRRRRSTTTTTIDDDDG